MIYDFDIMVERKNTNSIKYDFAAERGKPNNLLPLWVADMDFKVPIEVTDALVNCSKHSIFGYSDINSDYLLAVQNWFDKHFSYIAKPEWIVTAPGVVFSICTAIKAFTEIGDGVLIQTPVYHPFAASIFANQRKLVTNPLVNGDGKYSIDFDDFENKIIQNNVKLFILCSPHNPVGRVWTKDELLKIGTICMKHNCLVFSDEVHCDFVHGENIHNVFSTVSDRFGDNAIIATAPSKTFNLAGLQVSNIFIQNEKLRHLFKKEIDKAGYSQLNTMGIVACKAAYSFGEDWLLQLNKYILDNIKFVEDFLREHLPKIKFTPPEGTYLLWLDFSNYNLTQGKLNDLIINESKLWLNSGDIFGKEGVGFQRMNIACQKQTLEKALNQLELTFKNL